MKTLRDAILIVIMGAAVGFGVNGIRTATSQKGLSLKTPWPDNRKLQQLAIPPSYQPGDSLLTLEDAYILYLGGHAIFVDAREPDEFRSGHIKGAINLPFEEWDKYWGSVQPSLDSSKVIVGYCEGLDCELSLFLARELIRLGYTKSYIFFGGWLKWKDAGLPVSKDVND